MAVTKNDARFQKIATLLLEILDEKGEHSPSKAERILTAEVAIHLAGAWNVHLRQLIEEAIGSETHREASQERVNQYLGDLGFRLEDLGMIPKPGKTLH